MNTDESKSILSEILKLLAVEVETIEVSERDGELRFSISTKQSGRLIGTRGEHLMALNHVMKKIAGKGGEEIRVTVDVNGYLERILEDLRGKAKVLAERAKSFKTDVELPPMNAYERLQVHSLLASDPDVETSSVGTGANRRVVIHPKN